MTIGYLAMLCNKIDRAFCPQDASQGKSFHSMRQSEGPMSAERIEAFIDKVSPRLEMTDHESPLVVNRSSLSLFKTMKRSEYDDFLCEFETIQSYIAERIENLTALRGKLNSEVTKWHRVTKMQKEDLISALRGHTIARMGAELDFIAKTADVEKYIASIGNELTDDFVVKTHGPETIASSTLENLKAVLSLWLEEEESNRLIDTLGHTDTKDLNDRNIEGLSTRPMRAYEKSVEFRDGRFALWKRYKRNKHEKFMAACVYHVKEALSVLEDYTDELEQHVAAINWLRYCTKSYEIIARAALSSL